MQTMPAIDMSAAARVRRHTALSFAEPPDADAAVRLLDAIASAPCPFSPVPMDRPLALYGAGSLGRLARDHLRAVGHEFLMVIDRDARKLAQSPNWTGVAVRHPDDVDDADKNRLRVAVSVVTSPYVPIEQTLVRQGFADVVPFYDLAESFRDVHPLSNGWFAPPMNVEDRKNTAAVLASWDDDISRAHHLQFIAWRRLREEWSFRDAPIPGGARFFIPEVAPCGDERLLDAGAHHGSVTKTFIERTQGAFGHIDCIEPDSANRAQLKANLRKWLPGDTRIAVHDCALAEAGGTAPFHGGLGYASQISATGAMRVTTRALDALGPAPTFVKLHLEGGELAALKGGRRTLLEHRPVVAATIYHNAEGIWKTPLWLMQNLPNYRFLFRADSWCGTGAVVYAIPKERFAQ